MIPKHIMQFVRIFFVAARFDERRLSAARCVHRPGSREPSRYRPASMMLAER